MYFPTKKENSFVVCEVGCIGSIDMPNIRNVYTLINCMCTLISPFSSPIYFLKIVIHGNFYIIKLLMQTETLYNGTHKTL